jgi:hypothetical protein
MMHLFHIVYGSTKFVGFLLMTYGMTLAIVMHNPLMEIIGLISYYSGVAQFCSEDIEDLIEE